MAFSVGNPIYDTEKKCHHLMIGGGPTFTGELVPPFSVPFDGTQSTALIAFVSEFLTKASQHFSKQLDLKVFMQRLVHSYLEGEVKEGVPTLVTWIPARVSFYPGRYEITWAMAAYEVETGPFIPEAPAQPEPEPEPAPLPQPEPPGAEMVEVEIPTSDRRKRPMQLLPASAQKAIRMKIRQARLKYTLARMRAERLTEKYYTKYGGFDGFDGSDSELSSDSEFNPNEAPRKI